MMQNPQVYFFWQRMSRPEQFSCQSAASMWISILTLVVKRMILLSFQKRRSSSFSRRGSIFMSIVKLNLYLDLRDMLVVIWQITPLSYSLKSGPFQIANVGQNEHRGQVFINKTSTNLKACSFGPTLWMSTSENGNTELIPPFSQLKQQCNSCRSFRKVEKSAFLPKQSVKACQLLQVRAQAMGLQCAKPIEQRTATHYDSREKTFQAQMRKIKEIASFPIKINNLRLLNFPKSFQNIKIALPHVFAFNVPFKDFHFQDNVHFSSKTYQEEFETSIQSLSDRFVQFWLQEKGGRMIQVLRLKVHQLFRGPVKHDHLIRELKGRLLFDFHIDQYLLSDFILSNCEVQWSDPSQHTDYTYYLSLMIGNSCSPIQASKVFEKHEKIKEVALTNVKIRSSEMRDAIVRIRIVDNATSENVLEEFLPVSKLQQQNGYKTIMKDQVAYEYREMSVCKDVCGHDQTLGEVQLQLKHLRSKLYAEQMDCVILSQDGIVMHTLTESPTRGSEKSQKLTLATILKYTDKLQAVKDSGINEYGFYSLLEEIFLMVQDKRFNITDQLFTSQESLLNFLLLLSDFLEPEDQTNNEYIWEIINHLSKEPILRLKYFCGIRNEQEKLIFAKKFYMFVANVVKKIIRFTVNGLTYKEFVCIHKFMAFAYFRLPWCQDQIIQVLKREGDPIISEQKMAQIGASYALKSPSKSYFYDWESSVLRLVKKDEGYMSLIKQLNQARDINPSWARLLFDRDYQQIFYSIYSQLWDQAQTFLNNNGKILWQYFPRYGELLQIFFGQINNSKILDFSPQMTKCNMKLIKNEKLLTSFMMLIFPKTHLFQTNCVIKCLSLIECYFNVILNDHKLLPNNFHYNYFYTGVKSILDSEHSYLLQKVLAIIYKFYNIFTKQFKDDINKLFINKVFYKLFLHWSQDVRNIFHLLLIFRIYEKDHQQNPEASSRKARHSECIQNKLSYEHMITALVNRRYFSRQKSKHKVEAPIRSEFYQKMKAKMAERSKQPIDSPPLLEKQEFSESAILRKCSYMETAPSLSKRKWSVAEESQEFEGVEPTQSQLKYTVAALKEFELAKSEPKPDQKVDKRSKLFQLDQDE